MSITNYALLSVEPSPDFEARVRTTIAAEPARSSWLRWWLPMLAATASLAVAIVWGIGPTVTSLCSNQSNALATDRLPTAPVSGRPTDFAASLSEPSRSQATARLSGARGSSVPLARDARDFVRSDASRSRRGRSAAAFVRCTADGCSQRRAWPDELE